MSFVHLHVHTEYSLLDGACRLDRLCSVAKERGQNAIAITDHGNLFGAVDFYKAAKKHGIKPIIGCEVYVAARTRFDKVHGVDSNRHHLVLLCENETGYKNLIKLVSSAWVDGFYTKPRIDRELLEKHHEGLIALSACLAGEIPKLIFNSEYLKAKETALWYSNLFGKDHYYLEMQNHGIPEQAIVNDSLKTLSVETGIPLVATNDVHYVDREDAHTQKILICIATNHTIDEENSIEFTSDNFYLKTEDEMRALFPNSADAIENTQKIADMCNFDFEFGNTKLPNFIVPDGYSHYDYFKKKCYEGLERRYGKNPDTLYIDRLEYELSVIKNMGYVDYFLIVADFIQYARDNGIPVGPGRGSGAGSICAYCMGITNVDPIKYNLIFERFLNPERVSMPDIDVDFCYERRQEVIDYVINKYGYDHVSQIITFGTMAARAAIRDVGRAMGMPYATVDNVAKKIPRALGITIEKALAESDELKSLYNSDEQIKDLIKTAKSVEGMPRNSSTHAAGIVITDRPVSDYVPLARNDESVLTQFTMTTIEELGLLKMDFLGLRTLTVINDCVKMIKKKNPDFDIENISYEDSNAYSLFTNGLTDGVFQCESPGMKSVFMRLKPTNLEDIIAVISLYRPGPMDSIDSYIRNRHNPENIRYKTPMLQSILDVTYGCMVYQEQVMQIFRSLAGYSLGRADIVRRAMSKKKHKVMEEERAFFCDGCAKNGISNQIANEIFDDMSSFASYAFNKSHAAAYARIAYETAYLKCRYFSEYLSALMTSVLSNTSKLLEYIAVCEAHGTAVLRPDINTSDMGFTAAPEGIRFGLLAIRGLGTNVIRSLLDERAENGKYKSLQDFCERNGGGDVGKRAVENLIRAGAFDGLGWNRRQMLDGCEQLLAAASTRSRTMVSGQLSLFGEMEEEAIPVMQPPELPEYPEQILLKMEKELTGLYLSGHPLGGWSIYRKLLRMPETADLSMIRDGTPVRMLCLVGEVRRHMTRRGEDMCFFTAEDLSGTMDCIAFQQAYRTCHPYLKEDAVVCLTGRISRKDQSLSLICEDVLPEKRFGELFAHKRLCCKVNDGDTGMMQKLITICRRFPGDMPVCLFLMGSRRYLKPNLPGGGVQISSEFYRALTEQIQPSMCALIDQKP